jgi:hypothetical protein
MSLFGPHLRGWVVFEMVTPPRNADDLHVIGVLEDPDSCNDVHYCHYRGGHRIWKPALCKPFRYRSGARKAKAILVREMKLGRSNWFGDE